MKRISEADNLSAVTTLCKGGIAVLRTDTIYGIVARANDQSACERVYAAKGRDGSKPCIVLVSDEGQMWDEVSREAYRVSKVHVGDEPTSVIVPAGPNTPTWIPHGNGTVAFRVPQKASLRSLLKTTGPLIAPSANPAGDTPAASIEQAEAYFDEAVDIYVDGGAVVDAKPSHIIRVSKEGIVEKLR